MRVSLTLTASYHSALTKNQNKLNLVTGQAEIADRMNPWPIGAALPNVHLRQHTYIARQAHGGRPEVGGANGRQTDDSEKAEPIASRSLNWQI